MLFHYLDWMSSGFLHVNLVSMEGCLCDTPQWLLLLTLGCICDQQNTAKEYRSPLALGDWMLWFLSWSALCFCFSVTGSETPVVMVGTVLQRSQCGKKQAFCQQPPSELRCRSWGSRQFKITAAGAAPLRKTLSWNHPVKHSRILNPQKLFRTINVCRG